MANPQPDYDKLMNIQDWIFNPNSPLQKHLKEAMIPHQAAFDAKAKSGKMTLDEYEQANDQYHKAASQEMLKWIHSQFEGGKVPDAKDAQEYEYARRQQKMLADGFTGGPEEADKIVRSGQPAYGNAYTLLSQLQQIIPKQQTAAITMPAGSMTAAPTRPTSRASAPVATPGTGGPMSDDEKLSDTQLKLLEGLSKQALGTGDNHTGSYDEADAPKLDPANPASFLNVGMPAAPAVETGADAPSDDNFRDKAIMDNLKKMLLNEDDKNSYDRRFGK